MASNGSAHANQLPQTMQEVEQLVVRLYQPGHPTLLASINDQLQQLQKSEHGWKLADELMASEKQEARFFAALTFQVKLNNEGPSLDAETARTVQNRLIHWMVRLVQQGESKMVVKKMCSTLVTYFIRSPTLWRHSLLHLAASFKQGNAADEPTPTPQDFTQILVTAPRSLSQQQLAVLLEFAATLADDVGKVDAHSSAHSRIHDEMENIVKEANAFMAHAFSQPESSDATIKRAAIACFGSWTNYAQLIWPRVPEALQYLRDMVPAALSCIYDEETNDDALEMFRDILESYTSFFEPGHMEAIAQIITNYIAPILERAVADKDPSGEPYGRFVTAYGSANVKQVVEDSSEGRGSGIVVKLVLDFMASDGYAGDDLFLAFGSIEFWNTYIEYVNDEIFSATSVEEQPDWTVHAIKVAKRVVELLWHKLWTPPAEIAKGWRDEEREMFKEYRQDASDLMLSMFVLLGDDMLKQLVDFTLSSLNAQQWRGVEAGLFCLNNVADNVMESAESEKLMAAVFQSSLFRDIANFDQPIPAKARRTAVDMLGSYGGYIERHPEFLPDTVSFLFTALEKAGLANVAAKSIESLCSTCRVNLTGHLPGFLEQYQRFLSSPTCETYTKEKVIGAIAAIVQALQPESAKAEPLLALLENVHKDIASAKQYAAAADPDMTELMGVSALECLASIAKGLQIPDDVPVDLDADEGSHNTAANFWSTEQGQAVQQQIMSCFSVLQVVGAYPEAIEAVCKVLKCGFTETEPGPFVLPASVTVSFLQECSIQTPQLDHVLGTVCTLISQHSRKDAPRIESEVNTICTTVLSFIRNLGQPTHDPGVAMSCIDVLNRMMPAYCQVLFSQLDPGILDFTLEAVTGQNTFTKKAASDIWTKMMKPQAADIPVEVRERISEIIGAYGPKFTAALMSQIGGNALRSDLDFLCEPLKALLLHQAGVQGWLQQAVLGNENIGEGRVSDQQRTMFLKQVVATRGDGNKIRALVKQFWATCRGTVVAYGS